MEMVARSQNWPFYLELFWARAFYNVRSTSRAKAYCPAQTRFVNGDNWNLTWRHNTDACLQDSLPIRTLSWLTFQFAEKHQLLLLSHSLCLVLLLSKIAFIQMNFFWKKTISEAAIACWVWYFRNPHNGRTEVIGTPDWGRHFENCRCAREVRAAFSDGGLSSQNFFI